MKTTFIIAALAFAGCGGKKADSSRCTEVAAAAVDGMLKQIVTSPQMPADAKASIQERGDKLKGVIANRCAQDGWSADVMDCYAKATSMPDIRTCRGKLPADQSGKLQAEEMAAMGAGMAPHGAMPPATPPPPAPTPPANP